jgi:hypothetical protein
MPNKTKTMHYFVIFIGIFIVGLFIHVLTEAFPIRYRDDEDKNH